MHDVWLEYVSGRLGIHPAYDIFRLGHSLAVFLPSKTAWRGRAAPSRTCPVVAKFIVPRFLNRGNLFNPQHRPGHINNSNERSISIPPQQNNRFSLRSIYIGSDLSEEIRCSFKVKTVL